MKKGFVIPSIGKLVLIALGVFILGFLLLSYVLPGAIGLLDQYLNPETPEEAYFRELVECSYYRCFIGCNAGEIKDLLDGACEREFCNEISDDFKDDNKICGWDAEQYPIEKGGIVFKVSSSRLAEVADCVITQGTTSTTLTLSSDYKWIFIDSDLMVDIEKESCEFSIRNYMEDSVISASIGEKDKEKDVYVFSYSGGLAVIDIPTTPAYQRVTMVEDAPRYVLLELDEPAEEKEFEQKKHRVAIETVDELLEYWIEVTKIGTIPLQHVNFFVKNKTFSSREITLTVFDPDSDYYLNVIENYLHIKFKDVVDGKAVLELKYTSTAPPEIVEPQAEYLPDDELHDAWTEQFYFDNWIADNKQMSSDSKVGDYSFYAYDAELRFSFWSALGGPITIDNWDELHFWFKELQYGSNLVVNFDAEDGIPYEAMCSLGEYKPEDGWVYKEVNLATDCYWHTDKKPIMSVIFSLAAPGKSATAGYIDGLHFCKNC